MKLVAPAVCIDGEMIDVSTWPDVETIARALYHRGIGQAS